MTVKNCDHVDRPSSSLYVCPFSYEYFIFITESPPLVAIAPADGASNIPPSSPTNATDSFKIERNTLGYLNAIERKHIQREMTCRLVTC